MFMKQLGLKTNLESLENESKTEKVIQPTDWCSPIVQAEKENCCVQNGWPKKIQAQSQT